MDNAERQSLTKRIYDSVDVKQSEALQMVLNMEPVYDLIAPISRSVAREIVKDQIWIINDWPDARRIFYTPKPDMMDLMSKFATGDLEIPYWKWDGKRYNHSHARAHITGIHVSEHAARAYNVQNRMDASNTTDAMVQGIRIYISYKFHG